MSCCYSYHYEVPWNATLHHGLCKMSQGNSRLKQAHARQVVLNVATIDVPLWCARISVIIVLTIRLFRL